MRPLFTALLAGFGLLLACPAYAAETGTVAATPAEKAADCGYIVDLCATRRQQEQEQQGRAQKLRELQDETRARPDETLSPAELAARRQRRAMLAAEEEVGAEISAATANELAGAMTAVRAKYETMPECFEQCGDILNLEKFK